MDFNDVVQYEALERIQADLGQCLANGNITEITRGLLVAACLRPEAFDLICPHVPLDMQSLILAGMCAFICDPQGAAYDTDQFSDFFARLYAGVDLQIALNHLAHDPYYSQGYEYLINYINTEQHKILSKIVDGDRSSVVKKM